nr:hypothetical protein [Tanacetum cinerariifolium]
ESAKNKSNYQKTVYNKFAKKVQHPTSKPNPKASVKQKSKEVVKPKPKPSEEGEDDEFGSDENVTSNERNDGDNEISSVENDNIVGDGDFDEEDEEYEAKESE